MILLLFIPFPWQKAGFIEVYFLVCNGRREGRKEEAETTFKARKARRMQARMHTRIRAHKHTSTQYPVPRYAHKDDARRAARPLKGEKRID